MTLLASSCHWILVYNWRAFGMRLSRAALTLLVLPFWFAGWTIGATMKIIRLSLAGIVDGYRDGVKL